MDHQIWGYHLNPRCLPHLYSYPAVGAMWGRAPPSSWFLHLSHQSLPPVFSRKWPRWVPSCTTEPPGAISSGDSAACLHISCLDGWFCTRCWEGAQLLFSFHHAQDFSSSHSLRALFYTISEHQTRPPLFPSPSLYSLNKGLPFYLCSGHVGHPTWTFAPLRAHPLFFSPCNPFLFCRGVTYLFIVTQITSGI